MSLIQLKYIESTGSQYIDTGYTPTGDTSVKMNVAFPDLSANSTLFCARADKSNQTTYSSFLVLNATPSGLRYDYNNINTANTGIIPTLAQVVEVYANKNKMYVDGVLELEHDEATFTAGGRLWLFKAYYITDSVYTAVSNLDKMRLYACQIYEGDILVRDYVPMHDSDTDNTGLYDKVNSVFYTSGSDNFIAGPVANKYLVRSGSTIYTAVNNVLEAMGEFDLTADVFHNYGTYAVPDSTFLVALSDPEVLCWQESSEFLPEITIAVTGTPPVPQVVVTESFDMSDPTILGIESITVTASNDVLFAISFDDGATWSAYDGSQWVTLEQENSGMTKETFEHIGLEAWTEVVTSNSYRLRFALMDSTSYVSEITINYLN